MFVIVNRLQEQCAQLSVAQPSNSQLCSACTMVP